MSTSKPYKKILFNASSLTIMQAIGDFSGLILYVVLSRYYGPEGIGIYAFGYSIATISFNFINFGFNDFGIRECSRISIQERQVLIGKIVSVQLVLLLVVMSFLALYLLFAGPAFTDIIVLFSLLINLVLVVFSKTFFIPSNSQQSMIFPGLSELLMRLSTVAAVTVAVIVFSVPIYIALIPYSFFGILLLLVAFRTLKKYNKLFKLSFNLKDLILLVKTVWPFSASLIMHPIYTRSGIIILTFIMGNAAAGIYAPAQKVFDVGLMPMVLLGYSVYPVLSNYFSQNYEKFEDSAEKYFRAIFIIASIILWVLYYILPLIIIPLFGDKFADSIVLVKYFAVATFLFSFKIGFHRLLLASNLQVLRIKFQSFALFANLILNFALIPFWGAKGAVMALILSEISSNLLIIFVLYKNDNALFKRLIKTLGEFLISFSIALLPAVLGIYFIISEWFIIAGTLIIFISAIFITGFIQKFDIKFLRTGEN